MSRTFHEEDRVEGRGLASTARRRWPELLVGLILILLTLGIVAWMAVHLVHTDQLKARQLGLPVPVEVVPAAVRPLQMAVGASGTLSALNVISITARVNSRVMEVPVDLGDIVRKGDSLAILDDRIFSAGLDSAKSAADHAAGQFQRMKTLEERGFGAAADTEKARADADAAKQVVVQSQIDLGNTKVTSPVDAVVLTRSVNPGETTKIDQELFELGPIEQIYLVAEVSTDKTPFVAIDTPAEVNIDSFPGENFAGKVVKIDARASVVTRTFSAYIRIDNPKLRLKPGVTGYARLSRSHSALAIPGVAVLNPLGNKAIVYVIDKDNRARIREVQPGLAAEGMTEILSGLGEGEKVVTVGQLELHDGDKVAINPTHRWNP